jgi:hypothetical protein
VLLAEKIAGLQFLGGNKTLNNPIAGNKMLNNGLCLLVLVSESDVLAAATSVLLSDLFPMLSNLFRLKIAVLQFQEAVKMKKVTDASFIEIAQIAAIAGREAVAHSKANKQVQVISRDGVLYRCFPDSSKEVVGFVGESRTTG